MGSVSAEKLYIFPTLTRLFSEIRSAKIVIKLDKLSSRVVGLFSCPPGGKRGCIGEKRVVISNFKLKVVDMQ